MITIELNDPIGYDPRWGTAYTGQLVFYNFCISSNLSNLRENEILVETLDGIDRDIIGGRPLYLEWYLCPRSRRNCPHGRIYDRRPPLHRV
jgi:hypothetical protein